MGAWASGSGVEARQPWDPGSQVLLEEEEEDSISPAPSPDVLSRFQGISLRSGVPPNLQFKTFLCSPDSATSLAHDSSLASTTCPSSAVLAPGAFAEAPSAEAAATADDAVAAAALEAECGELWEEIRQVDAEVRAASLETERLAAGPRRLRAAQAELRGAEEEVQAQQRQTRRQYELQARLNRRLKRQLQEVEEQQAWEFHQSRLMSCDAARRLEQARSRFRRDLQHKQHQASQCARALQDCNQMDAQLHRTYQQNLDRLNENLQSLQQARRRRAMDACRYRDEALEQRACWRAERSLLIRDLAHLESHLSETSSCISQCEADEEDAERRYACNEAAAGEIWERVRALAPTVEGEVQCAERAEWELAELRASLRFMGMQSLDLLASAGGANFPSQQLLQAECVGATVAVDAPPSHRASASPAYRPALEFASPRSPGVSGLRKQRRSPSPHLAAMQSRAMQAQGRLDEAMQDLRQQQVVLERQLQKAMAAEEGEAEVDA